MSYSYRLANKPRFDENHYFSFPNGVNIYHALELSNDGNVRLNIPFKKELDFKLYVKCSNDDLTTLKYNYLIIHDDSYPDPANGNIYYDIVDYKYKGSYLFEVTCSFDFKFGQNILNDFVGFSGQLQRMHVNRFIKNDSGNYEFDFSEGSYLQNTDSDIPQLYQKLDSVVYPTSATGGSNILSEEVQNWINENVKGWCYIFLNSSHSYVLNLMINGEKSETSTWTFPSFKSNLIETTNSNVGFKQAYSVLVAPLYKGGLNHRIIFDFKKWNNLTGKQEELKLDFNANFTNLCDENDGYSHIFAIQVLPINPLLMIQHPTYLTYSIENNNLIIKSSFETESSLVGNMPCGYLSTTDKLYRFFSNEEHTNDSVMLQIEKSILNKYMFNSLYQKEFTKGEIASNKRNNLNLEPKLLQPQVQHFDLYIGSTSSQSFDYRYVDSDLVVSSYSSISPLISKINYQCNDLYGVNSTLKLGFTFSEDMSLLIANSQLDNFLANNKNFWQQKVGSVFSGSLSGFVSGSMMSGNVAIGGVMGASSLLSGGLGLINSGLTLNNYANAPMNLENGQGNVDYMLQTQDGIGLRLLKYKALECDMWKIADYYFMYGYPINRLVDDMNTFYKNNKRSNFNYVQGNFTLDLKAIDNKYMKIYEKILNDLTKGIFIINVASLDSFDIKYNKENYEVNL